MSLAGLAIGAILVGVLVIRIDLRESWRSILRMDPRLIWLPAVMLMVGLTIRPWRWQLIFPKPSRPGFWPSFTVWSVANMSNNVLPARGGDVLRCFLIARGQGMNRASLALATLGLEKVLDGLALLLVVALSSHFLAPPGWLANLTIVAAMIFGGAFAAMVILHYRPRGFQRAIRMLSLKCRHPRLGRRGSDLLGSFAEGLNMVGSWRQMTRLALLTAVTWFVEMAYVWAVAQALGLHLSLWAGMVVAAILGLGLMIPAAPAYVGSYEFFSVAVLGMFGVAPEQALSLAIVMHAGVLLMTTAFGLAGLASTGISRSRPMTGGITRQHSEEAVTDGE